MFSVSALKMILTMDFLVGLLYQFKEVLFYSVCSDILIMNKYEFCQMLFSTSIEI